MKIRISILCLLALLVGCGRSVAPAQPMLVDALPASSLPRLGSGADQALWLSWVEDLGEKQHRLRFARLLDTGWSAPVTVAQGADWFVNWADFPSVILLEPPLAAAHWLVKRPGGTYAYDVAIALSSDEGASWGPPLTPHQDLSPTEHGFVSLFRVGDDLGAIWLDGRKMASPDAAVPDESSEPAAHNSHGDHGGGMSLRFGLISATAGAMLDQEIDPLTCDCCQTGAAALGDGSVIAVYRDRDEEEIRDIYFSRLENGVWSPGQRLAADDWHIEGCPVNGPAIDARDQRVAVVWFTGAGDTPRVRASWSQDGGRHFSAPLEIADARALGRVDVAMLPDGDAVTSWMAGADNGLAEIRYRRLYEDGGLGSVHTLDTTSSARSAGFPQVAAGGEGLIFAWTRVDDEGGVAVATVPLPE
jgi:hypothetical protein